MLEQHQSGTPGMQVSTLLADLYDDVVLDVWNEAIREHTTDERLTGLSLVAHGGFGRRDLAPYSDADLMLLSTRSAESLANKIAGNLTRDLGDAGIHPGLAIRIPDEACRLSWHDPVVFSSLAESRLLAGSLQLYTKYFQSFRHGGDAPPQTADPGRGGSPGAGASQVGRDHLSSSSQRQTVARGLRDIQLIRWIGFARYGETDLGTAGQTRRLAGGRLSATSPGLWFLAAAAK